MSFSFIFNCFRECKITNLFCCFRGKKKRKIKIQPIEKFIVKDIKNIDLINTFDDVDFFILISIFNNNNKIVSLTRRIEKDIYLYDKNDDIKKIIGSNFYYLMNNINRKVRERKKVSGCIIEYENYNYIVLGFPIIDENNLLSTIIIKKLYIELTDFNINDKNFSG